MKVILLRDNAKPPIKFNINKWWFVTPILLGLAVMIVLSQLGINLNIDNKYLFSKTESASLSGVNSIIRNNVLESQVPSLYTQDSKLDKHVAQGGISGEAIEPESEEMVVSYLLETIRETEKNLSEKQLEHDLLQASIEYNEYLLNPVKPPVVPDYFSPVKTGSGWVSSRYGMRKDPINGKHRYHKGVDIAGKKGTPIDTIASGFVTFSGRKGGYGNVVEVHHSDSLKSRYAHLDKIYVKKGMIVQKGEKIATMGSTGRVTGPHLHLEVWRNGKAINPEEFLDLAL